MEENERRFRRGLLFLLLSGFGREGGLVFGAGGELREVGLILGGRGPIAGGRFGGADFAFGIILAGNTRGDGDVPRDEGGAEAREDFGLGGGEVTRLGGIADEVVELEFFFD
jgi:hypothetical protein